MIFHEHRLTILKHAVAWNTIRQVCGSHGRQNGPAEARLHAWQLASTYKVLCLVALDSCLAVACMPQLSMCTLDICTLVLTTLWLPCQRTLAVKLPLHVDMLCTDSPSCVQDADRPLCGPIIQCRELLHAVRRWTQHRLTSQSGTSWCSSSRRRLLSSLATAQR